MCKRDDHSNSIAAVRGIICILVDIGLERKLNVEIVLRVDIGLIYSTSSSLSWWCFLSYILARSLESFLCFKWIISNIFSPPYTYRSAAPSRPGSTIIMMASCVLRNR